MEIEFDIHSNILDCIGTKNPIQLLKNSFKGSELSKIILHPRITEDVVHIHRLFTSDC
jgi:hypothetical protein